MARISTYPIDLNISGSDKWIGTDAGARSATKNFTVDKVADYLNTSGIIQSQALRYIYKNTANSSTRYNGTISFQSAIGDNVAFEDIDTFLLSRYAKPSRDVYTFYSSPLSGSTVLLTNANNVSNWAVYLWNSSTQDVDEENFYNIDLTFISGSGGLVDGEDYLISLLGLRNTGDKTAVYTQSTPSDVWEITHNLDKYPSVSVVDSAKSTVYGNIDYINANELTITFSAPFSGQAFMN